MVDMPEGTTLREMQPNDVRAALEIIEQHDEDDFAWASEFYHNTLFGQFVMTKNDQVIGVTGANPVEETDGSWMISWTYLKRDLMGHGYGRAMLEGMLAELRAGDCRKVFVNTSDYIDPEDGDIYRDAREAYRAVGFQEEMRHNHYYDANESLISFGLRLIPPDPVPHSPNVGRIRLTDIDEIDECEGAYWLAWELDDEGSDVNGMQMIIDQVRKWEGRVIFMGFPSDLQNAEEFVTRARFKRDGQLRDFYEDGVDQVHFRLDLL